MSRVERGYNCVCGTVAQNSKNSKGTKQLTTCVLLAGGDCDVYQVFSVSYFMLYICKITATHTRSVAIPI